MPKRTRKHASFRLLGIALSVFAVLLGGFGGVARRSHDVTRRVATARVEQLNETVDSTRSDSTGTESRIISNSETSAATGDPARSNSVPTNAAPSSEATSPLERTKQAQTPVRTVKVMPLSERPLQAVVDAPPALGTRIDPVNPNRSVIGSDDAAPITTMTFDEGTFPDLRSDPRSVDAARQSGATLPSIDPPRRVETPATTSPPRAKRETRTSQSPAPSTSPTTSPPQQIAVRTIVATAAAFVDPCTRKPVPKGCGRGLNATVLAQHRVNEPYPQVSLHGGSYVGYWDDCAEQLGNVNDDLVAVIASNVPLNRMQAHLVPTRDPNTPEARAGDATDVLDAQPHQTATRLASWDHALQYSETLPSLGSCIRIPRGIAEKYAVNSNFTFSVKLRATTRTGRAISTTLAAAIPTWLGNTDFSVELNGISPRLLRATTRFRQHERSD